MDFCNGLANEGFRCGRGGGLGQFFEFVECGLIFVSTLLNELVIALFTIPYEPLNGASVPDSSGDHDYWIRLIAQSCLKKYDVYAQDHYLQLSILPKPQQS